MTPPTTKKTRAADDMPSSFDGGSPLPASPLESSASARATPRRSVASALARSIFNAGATKEGVGRVDFNIG